MIDPHIGLVLRGTRPELFDKIKRMLADGRVFIHGVVRRRKTYEDGIRDTIATMTTPRIVRLIKRRDMAEQIIDDPDLCRDVMREMLTRGPMVIERPEDIDNETNE